MLTPGCLFTTAVRGARATPKPTLTMAWASSGLSGTWLVRERHRKTLIKCESVAGKTGTPRLGLLRDEAFLRKRAGGDEPFRGRARRVMGLNKTEFRTRMAYAHFLRELRK